MGGRANGSAKWLGCGTTVALTPELSIWRNHLARAGRGLSTVSNPGRRMPLLTCCTTHTRVAVDVQRCGVKV